MRIGFFDSGVGGLTVLHAAAQALASSDFIYYADTDNVPYGDKTKEQVRDYVFRAADFLTGQGIDVLVVACNTATSVAIEALRQAYAMPIIGMEPAVKPAVENHNNKRVLVTATQLTLREDKLRQLITRLDCEDIVDLLALPALVTYAERAVFDGDTLRRYLSGALNGRNVNRYQTVVLGCTHFIFYRQIFRSLLGPDIDIIDGNAGTVRQLVQTIETLKIPLGGDGRIDYYHSGRAVRDGGTLRRYETLLQQLDQLNNTI